MIDEIVAELLPPSEYGVFKTLLTHPDARPILRDIISSILQIRVTDVEVKNVELPISDISQKRERFDVNSATYSGEQVDVEMQSSAMNGDTADNRHVGIKSRAIFNLCDLHSSQSGRGIQYHKLMRSFQIMFCNYTVFVGRKDFVNRFGFRNEDGDELLDSVGIVFIELSKLDAVLKKPIEDLTDVEMWSIFFSVANKLEYRQLINGIIHRKEEVELASHLLEGISNDPVQVAHFLSRRRFQAVAFEQGEIKGRAEGEIESKIKGKIEGMTEIAQKLLRRNRPTEEIIELTELLREEIEAIRGDL
jgi:predicted transposase/invertase (TIGR01784 family)